MPETLVTIFVRHAVDCKYAGDEFAKRCSCWKHLRWTHKGKQHRRAAGTRTWAEAEIQKREREDQLAGRVATPVAEPVRDIAACVSVFVQDKRVQGLTEGGVKKYERLLARLGAYCTDHRVYTVQGITREIITGFMGEWPAWYPSTVTRSKTRELLRGFLRYCYEAQWLDRIPQVPGIKIDEPETQPLTPEEYERLVQAVVPAIQTGGAGRRITSTVGHRSKENEGRYAQRLLAFIETMRWTGLAIHDTATLRRSALSRGDAFDLVTTQRQKTGTHVSVPIPPRVGALLRALPDIGEYFFWTGRGQAKTFTSKFGQRYMVPTFKTAGIESEGHMVSHRLRDTFAVDLLEKGVPMEEVSKLLGHTSIRTTERSYAKWSKGRQDRVNALVSGTW